MIFESVRLGLSDRIIEIDDMINFIENQPLEIQSSRLSNSIKGVVSILLYGCVEYVVTNSIKKMELYISSQNMRLNEYSPILFSRFLNSQFESIAASERETKWKSRLEFCKKILENIEIKPNLCEVQTLPTNGKNIRGAQLKSICDTYGLNINDIILDRTFKGKLDDIVNKRCVIAHGNVTAHSVGSNYAPSDLKERRNLINDFCTNFIEILQKYIDDENYKPINQA